MKHTIFSLVLVLAPVIVEAKPLHTNQDRPSKITVLQTLDFSGVNSTDGTIHLANGCFIRLRMGLNGPATNVNYILRAGQELNVSWVEASYNFKKTGDLDSVWYRLGIENESRDLADGAQYFDQAIHTIGCTADEKGIDSDRLDEAFAGILSFEWQK
jgi:hypothetical protein